MRRIAEREALILARWSIALAAVTLLAACETAAPDDPLTGPASPAPVVKVAYVRDLSVPDADEHALPALQAIRLAFETATLQDPTAAPVELEEFDLTQDSAELGSIDADPSYVGVIVAPGVNGDDAELDTDLPVLSLSGLGAGDGRRAFVRMVAPLATVADTLAGRLRRSSACVLSEDPPPDPLFGLLSDALPGATARTIDPSAAAEVVGETGCDVVIWAGGPDAGAQAARALGQLRGRVRRRRPAARSRLPVDGRDGRRRRVRALRLRERLDVDRPRGPAVHPELPVRARRRPRRLRGRGLGRGASDPARGGRPRGSRARWWLVRSAGSRPWTAWRGRTGSGPTVSRSNRGPCSGCIGSRAGGGSGPAGTRSDGNRCAAGG